MKQTCHDGFAIASGLDVGLKVVCGDREVIQPKEFTQCLEKFAHELRTVVLEEKGEGPV